jgi:isoleucyl-tRNA synthetase
LWCHREINEWHPNSVKLILEVANIIAEKGIEAWQDIQLDQFAVHDAKDYFKIEDTLDVWFDSGVSFYAVLMRRPELQFPADLYLEGTDQHRGWFQTTLLASVAATGNVPYKAVLTHGFTDDANGRKMSKSLGNVIAPEKVVTTLGADILRLWVAATDYKTELAVSDEILQRNTDGYRRIRNTTRFLLANTFDFDPAKDSVAFKDMVALDQWVVDRAYRVQQEIKEAYQQYQFHTVYQKIHHFCSIDLGSFYLDVIKDRQYTIKRDALARRSAQTAMMLILEALVRWLMPILSFTAEEIWQCLPGQREQSVLLATYYEDLSSFSAQTTMNAAYFETVMRVRDEVNKVLEAARTEGVIGSGLEAKVTIIASAPLYDMLTAFKDELRFVLITSAAAVQAAPAGSALWADGSISGLCHIAVEKMEAPKCARCWHRREDVGVVEAHPEICQRCVDNIDGAGETRHYA